MNKKAETDSDTENRLVVASGDAAGGVGEEGEGTEEHRRAVTEQPRDARCRTGNAASDSAVTLCAAGRVLGVPGETRCKEYDSLTTMLYT